MTIERQNETAPPRPVRTSESAEDSRTEASEAGPAPTQRELLARQRQRFGGVKIGSALFGWLAATGTGTILAALLAALGATMGLDAQDAASMPAGTAGAAAVGWAGVIVLVAVVGISYFCGGYVAGRMARFDGAVQGLAVWVWGLVIGVVAALASVVVDSRFGIFQELSTMPRLPMSDGDLTLIGLVGAGLVALAGIGCAVAGGLAGTRFHRRVDRVALRG